MKNLNTTFFLLVATLMFSGCGGDTVATWPSNAENDWIKLVQGKGMANVWGIAIDVAGVEDGTEISINPEATLGETADATTGKNVVIFGKRIVTLEATGKKMIKLSMNGRDYGTVAVGSRVAIDQDNNVYVDQETRKPVK